MRRQPRGTIDRRFRSLRLTVARGRDARVLMKEGEQFRRWALAVALAAPLLAMAAACLRGWPAPINWEPVATVSLGAFLWSAALFRVASHVPTLEHAGWFRAANSLMLASLGTMLISITGGALSPLFWVYAVLIVADARQSWWRAAATAWLSWIMLCGLVAMQVSGKMPDAFTGIVWHVYPFQPGWLAHALGVEIWYFAIAVGLTGTARWMDEHEHVMRRREDVLGVRERAIAAEHAALQTARQELGQRSYEFDQTKRRFEAERLRWDDERRREAALEGALPGPYAPHL